MLTKIRRFLFTWTDAHGVEYCSRTFTILGLEGLRMIQHHNHKLAYDIKLGRMVLILP